MFTYGHNDNKTAELSDTEIIAGIQGNDNDVERNFYLSCKAYFKARHHSVIDFKGRAREEDDLFQESFLKLWQEIQRRQIHVRDNHPWRIDRNGDCRKMSASLKTYLMAIARYKNYELLREEAIYVPGQPGITPYDEQDMANDLTAEWIVEVCVNELPRRCKEILTMFYYEKKNLDEILAIRNENQSKDGLKTGKSKCLKSLRERVSKELRRHDLKPYPYV